MDCLIHRRWGREECGGGARSQEAVCYRAGTKTGELDTEEDFQIF